ncbi:Transmembrane domain-containing protein, partial [Cedratvirus Zaza IHUMI]
VIVLGILLSFGLFFLLRNSDTEQTNNVLIASPSATALPFASCQTSSQCLTSQICSNGRCTNVVDNVQNNLTSTFSAPQPVPVVPVVTGITEPVPEDNIAQEIENLERLMERQNGDLRSLQTTLERHIESNQSKLSNLENTIISKGVRDLPPPPSTRRSNIRDLPPPSYVQDDEDFTEPLPVQEGGSTTIQSVNNLPLRGNTSLSTQATGLLTQATTQSVNNLPTQVNNLPTRGTVQQPTFNLPLRSTYIAQQTATLAQQPVTGMQTNALTQQQTTSVRQPTQTTSSVQQQPIQTNVLPQQQPVVLSGAVVNPTLTAQPVPIVAPSTVVLSGNNNLPRSNNLANRNPYINGDDPFEQFAQQDLPPPAILQTRPVREERKNCRKDASCPLVPAEVPRCKRNKDKKAVVWQL